MLNQGLNKNDHFPQAQISPNLTKGVFTFMNIKSIKFDKGVTQEKVRGKEKL